MVNKIAFDKGYYIIVKNLEKDRVLLEIGGAICENDRFLEFIDRNGIISYTSYSSYPDIQNKQVLREINDKSIKDVVDEFVNILCDQIEISTDVVLNEDKSQYFKKD